MQGMTNDMIKPGDFVKFRGHKVQDRLQDRWWKAERIEGTTVHLVDRHGATARVSAKRKYQEMRAMKWQPGDDRSDGR